MAPDYLRPLSGFGYVGFQRYFLTWCTAARKPHFVDRAVVGLVLEQILRAAGEETIALLAYCFVPDHLHLLIEGQAEASDGRRFIRRARQFSAYHHVRAGGGRLWQKYGYERTLRDDDATLPVARYIFHNPVRAGLVARADAYPFSGSERYTIGEILDATEWSG